MAHLRDKAAFVLAAAVFVAAGFVFYYGSRGIENPPGSQADHARVYTLESLQAFDVTDERALVGFAENVFVGRVVRQVGSEPHARSDSSKKGETVDPREPLIPQSQFTVEVLDNVKGQLRGTVTVNQSGGRIPGENALSIVDRDPLLRPGEIVMFATRFDEESRRHDVTTNKYADVRIAPGERARLVEKFQAAKENQFDPLAPDALRGAAEGRP